MKCKNLDEQHHLLSCEPILESLSKEQQDFTHTVNYEDIYKCSDQQKAALTAFSWLLEARDRLLGAATPASGSSLDASPVMGDIRGLGD